jgi:hypothetical protein
MTHATLVSVILLPSWSRAWNQILVCVSTFTVKCGENAYLVGHQWNHGCRHKACGPMYVAAPGYQHVPQPLVINLITMMLHLMTVM